MIKGPIWKDTYYSDSSDTLSYKIQTTAGTVIHQAYTKKMPGTTGVTLNINNKVDEYLKPDFDSDFSVVENEVIKNSKAFWNYGLYRDTIPESLLESYQFLYDWSYNEDWTGQTKYNMTEPINGHLDPRMKALFTIYNTGQTTFETVIDGQMLGSYLTLEIIEPGRLMISSYSGDSYVQPTISYSINGGEWSEPATLISFNGTTAPTLSAGDIVRLKGDNDYTARYPYDYHHLEIGYEDDGYAIFKAYGNVMSIIDSQNFMNMPEETIGDITGTVSHNLAGLFRGAKGLVDASLLCLPAQIVYGQGYYRMFAECTNLVYGPELPAICTSSYCYYSMFRGCTALTTAASTLPATKVDPYSYSEMFSGCISLTTAPSLPATKVCTFGYQYMFANCWSLTRAPEISAIEFEGEYNCEYMFAGCTALTAGPSVLPATTLNRLCYSHMFDGCISLITAPQLPATTMADSCYGYMFSGCTSLTKAPALPATTLAGACYSQMFKGCTSLVVGPELPANEIVGSAYDAMFENCTSLNYLKCLATDSGSSSGRITCAYWLDNVSSEGTFVKNPSIPRSKWTSGGDGIPYGWTVIDES